MAIDQMLSPEAMDVIVEGISAELCKDNPTEECPAAVDAVITQVWSHRSHGSTPSLSSHRDFLFLLRLVMLQASDRFFSALLVVLLSFFVD